MRTLSLFQSVSVFLFYEYLRYGLTEHFKRNTVLILGAASLCSQRSPQFFASLTLQDVGNFPLRLEQHFCWFVTCTFTPLFYHSPHGVLGIHIRWLRRLLTSAELTVVFIKAVCALSCFILLLWATGIHRVSNNALTDWIIQSMIDWY